ncbi:MAG: heavy-metal-associated domain-containing protein [Planctomycetes bacterium]|nr:heavy-metal-associated domain-containing protein [Planctomycetota bacterium]
MSSVAVGCGGGPPRKATPPDRDHNKAVRRDMFMIRGTVDEWHEAPLIKDGLSRLGGVESIEQDNTTGKYVVVFNPQRTSRDAIRRKIIEIGEEQGRKFEPIFDDR